MFYSLMFLWVSIMISIAIAAEFQTHYCDLNTTSSVNTTRFRSNLMKVLDSLASDTNISDKRFLNKSSGSMELDMAYALYLCRADVLPNDCRNCLLKAREDINNTCPLSKSAVLWSDNCMLRYANFSMTSLLNSETYVPECNKVNISDRPTDQNHFWERAMKLTNILATHVSTNKKKLFAYDKLSYNDTGHIYGYVQCTPDLSGSDCNKCLRVSIGRLKQYCYGKQGARVLAASCNVRFEIYEFLQFPSASSDKPGNLNINFFLL